MRHARSERDLTRERTMAGLAAARARGRRGGRPGKLTLELRRQAEAMLRDTSGYPFVSDVIRSLLIGRAAFRHHFPTGGATVCRGTNIKRRHVRKQLLPDPREHRMSAYPSRKRLRSVSSTRNSRTGPRTAWKRPI